MEMNGAKRRIEKAFERLAERPGFVTRENQIQLALFLSDIIEGKNSGAIEAPTGLGKSLALEGARFNNIMVYIKLAIIVFFLVIGAMHFNNNNWHPFSPFGFQGVI